MSDPCMSNLIKGLLYVVFISLGISCLFNLIGNKIYKHRHKTENSVETFTLNKCNHLLKQHYPTAECACFTSYPKTICYYPFSFGYLVVKCQSASWDSCTVGDRL